MYNIKHYNNKLILSSTSAYNVYLLFFLLKKTEESGRDPGPRLRR